MKDLHAGFGGSTVSIIKNSAIDEFKTKFNKPL